MVQVINRTKSEEAEEAKGTRETRVHVGQSKKRAQEDVSKKASQKTLCREIVERNRGRTRRSKREQIAFPEWYSSFRFFGAKVTPCDLGAGKKGEAKKA